MKFALTTFAMLLILCSYSTSPVLATNSKLIASGGISAKEAIDQAETSINNAYEAVVEAEKAGGNVSNLVKDLNQALGWLNSAKDYYEEGDYDSAVSNALKAKDLADQTRDAANRLKVEANQQAVYLRILTATVSVMGIILVCIFCYYGWKWWKKRYVKKVLKMTVKETSKDEV